jgi:DNA-binding SARP family transcriptional activator/tetratricopeptide (TPR) repeat protein
MSALADDRAPSKLLPRQRGPVAGSGPWKAEDASGLPASAALVRIRLLGRFAVLRGSEEIPLRAFSGRLPQQLLRLLALRRGELVPKDVIAGALWPRRPPSDPGGNIEVLVSRIRRALPDPALIRTGAGGYSLTAGSRCWVDAEAFLAAVRDGRKRLADQPAEALVSFRNALDMWQGEPLAEDTYAEWAQEDRRCLALALVEALEGAAAAALACGDPAEATSWAERAMTREPLRETSAMLAVQALATGGDQAGALAAFDSFRHRLACETGLDPSSEALALRQRVLREQPVPHAPAGEAARPLARLAEPGPFTGRQDECAAILSAAAGHGPRLVLVTGPGGVGKSRLLAEAARLAPVTVLRCQAYPPDRHEPWSVAGRLLRQARRVAGTNVVLPDREARALAILVPGIAALARPGPDAEDEQIQVFALQGAVRLVEAATRPRCLIVADDLHWADPTSLELLGVLLRRADQVSMVASYQLEDPGAMPSASFALPAEQVSHLPLGPLPAGAIRGLVGDGTLAGAILSQGERTPLAVTEVLAALARHGAVQLDEQGRWRLRMPGDAAHARSAVVAGQRQAAQDRLGRLPGRWRELLALLALFARPAPPGLLAGACGWTPREVLDCLDGLARAGLAQPGWRGWKLRHQLFGEAQVGTLVPAERARAHALLAQALERSGADAAEVAAHRAASGDRDGASVAYAAAAARRLEWLADAEAIGLAEDGLSLEPPAPARALLLDTRAEVYQRRGLLDEARADLTAALESCGEAAGRSRVLAELAILEARSVGVARGEELVELAIAEAQGRPGPLGQALAAGAITDLPAGNLARAGRRFRRARRLLEEADETRGSARLLYWQAMTDYMAGRLREAATRLADLAHLPALPAEVLRLWSPRATRGHVLAFMGEPETGLADIGETLAWAEAHHYPAVQSECLWRRSEALAFSSRAGEAAESAEQALAIATRLRHAACTAAALRGLGIAWDAAGVPDRAEQAFRRSARAAEGNPFFAAWASARLGACLARQGRPQDAAPHVRASRSTGPPLTRYEARWAHAELLAARGEDKACRAAAAKALRAAEEGGYLILVPRLRELARL